ncbi:hypothetical protein IWW36_004195 [Coemansia brasiliensis]|uniref:Nucleoside diphosphate kinase n=1 Tax=Coemansia brasiliensis TaxID=2650707 RepID=A0A9W8LWH6_9FUNG|nr:hypothetical protein IWW36_004195 [Coemansia brasiliensis]
MRATLLKTNKCLETTLALLKPDLFADHQTLCNIEQRIAHLFRISARRKVIWTTGDAQRFYAEHQGKPFYPRLISYMTSGPILALALTKHGAIQEWREMIGSTRPAQMRIERPTTLRAQFGLTDTRNSFHGSDSVASAERELEFFFGKKLPNQLH